MTVGKKKGSPKKGNQTTTRSKTKQQRQQGEIESLVLLSSPVTSRKPKKLSTVSEYQKPVGSIRQNKNRELSLKL